MDITIIIAKLKEEMKKLFATKEDVPTKTSDLINDNDFITNSDSRLSDSRTPTSHNHGQISNDGKITREAVTAASTDKIIITDADDYDRIKRTNKLLADHIQDTTAHSNIGSSANATQATINTNIDTALSGKEKSSNKVTSISSSNTDTQYPSAKATYNALNTKANINHTHENISDTGWQEVVFESGYVKYGDPVRYRRIGKVVHIEGIIKNTSAFTPSETAQKVATISDIYCRPQYTQYGLMQGTGANKFLLSIQPNGNIGIARYGTTATSTQIGANSWLHCNLTWMVETENVSYVTSFDSNSGFEYYYPNGFSYSPGDPLPAAFKLQKDSNREGIANQSIKFYIDNTLKNTQTTDSNGYVLFEVPFATMNDTHNTHTLRVDFNENAPYRPCTYTWTVGQNNNDAPIIA